MTDKRHCFHQSIPHGEMSTAYRSGHWMDIQCCHCGKITEISGEEIIKPSHGRFCPDMTVNYVYPTDDCPATPPQQETQENK